MKGVVDAEQRALLEVSIGNQKGTGKSSLMVWVDTAFNGGLVIPRKEIERLELQETSSTSAILADGQTVDLPTFSCASSIGSEKSTAHRLWQVIAPMHFSEQCYSPTTNSKWTIEEVPLA